MKKVLCTAFLLGIASASFGQDYRIKGGGQFLGGETRSIANDECANALFLPCNSPIQADLTQATSNPADPLFACVSRQGAGTVWYFFVAGATTASLTTSNGLNTADPDTMLAVYSGTCGAFTEIGCNDDIAGVSNRYSHIDLTGLTPGQVYYVQLAAYSSTHLGTYTLTLTEPPPPNDTCANAIALGCNAYVQADIASATNAANDPSFPCSIDPTGYNSVWYTFTPAGTTARLFTSPVTGGYADDSMLGVYVGSCNNLIQIACNDDADGSLYSDLNLVGLTPGNTYYVQLTAFYPGAAGSYGLNLECPNDCVTCPANSYSEAEVCETDTNGGCNSVPPAFETIPCGQTVCGTWFQDSARRDTDWFQFNLQESAFVQLCATAQVDFQVYLMNADCNNLLFYAGDYYTACSQACIGKDLPPGNYAFFMAPQFTTGSFACTDLGQWTARMTITPDCPGDMNGDGKVNTVDLAILLRSFGHTVSSCYVADSDHDGQITTIDLADLLRHFGSVCGVARPVEAVAADKSLLSTTR